jgi:cytochrome c biogenesis factor
MIYAFALHFNVLFLAYVGVLGCSVYAWASALLRRPFHSMGSRGTSRGRTRADWVLMVIGVLFGLLWLAEVIPALIEGTVPASMMEAG